ncbi:putative cytochrome b5 [Friedmanniomyces simplex]|uniref:Putative cytochrome b5 n=1 Tax=Friedmanniomyces simplex TaxID=329884 RepID=A0A4U0Y3I8_9PEZI|nr:putative cytochrome b5 [Friedmanniomyces simplex]
MSETKELTYSDVSEHTSKKDLYLVVHDKVYNCSSFVDEHPGGEEVLLDVGGQDATEAFEDVGHSDEAREILNGLLIGNLKRQAGDPSPSTSAPNSTPGRPQSASDSAGLGIGVYALILVGGALAFFAYQYLASNSQNKS